MASRSFSATLEVSLNRHPNLGLEIRQPKFWRKERPIRLRDAASADKRRRRGRAERRCRASRATMRQ
jgi:hypothetical protein